MNRITHLKEPRCTMPLMLAACLVLTLLPAAAQGPVYSVADCGANYRVWQAAVPVTDGLTGQVWERVIG